MQNKFLVVEWDLVEKNLTDEELENFYGMLASITNDEPEVDYYVVDTKETYADKVKAIIHRGTAKISREELIKELRELSELEDVELAHAEADELILSYVNDPVIEQAYEEVPKWYA